MSNVSPPTGLATEVTLVDLDGKFPAAAAASDAESNATAMTAARTRGEVFNGTTWDRLRGALAGVTAGAIATWTGMAQTLGLSRYLATRPTLADGEGTHLQSNTRGDLATQEQYLPDYEDNANDVAWTGNRALAVSTGAWTNYNSGTTKAGTTGISVKATAGRVRRIGCYNSGAGSVYLVIVNKATAAVNNDAVIAQIAVPSLGSVSLDLGVEGLYLATGISLAVSTAGEKVTLPASSDCKVWCQYL